MSKAFRNINRANTYMRSKYALFSLLMLLLVQIPGIAQDRPNIDRLTWMSKIQKVTPLKNQLTDVSTASGKPSLTRNQRQVWVTNAWFDSEDTRYHYNGSTRMSDEVFYYNGSTWNLEEKTTYEHNGTGYPTVILYEKYNGGQYTSKERYKLSYGYHHFTGEIILNQSEKEVWMNNSWVKDEKDVYQYLLETDGAFLIGITTSFWDDDLEAWAEYEKFEMEEANGHVIQTWSYRISEWIPTGRTIYHSTTLRELAAIMESIGEQIEVYASLPLIIVPLPETTLQYMTHGNWADREMTSKIPMYDWMSGRLLQWKTEVLEWDEDEEQWVASLAYLINYDEQMRPESTAFEIMMDDEVFRFTEDLFTYNERGLMAEGVSRVDYGEGLRNMSRQLFTWAGTGTSIGNNPEMPAAFNLGNAYPNPFNPATVIPYETGMDGFVTIRVYDILGRLVSTLYNGPQSAGKHQVRFDAAGFTSGKYLVRMEAPGYRQTRAVTLLK